jgi:hypothetical protein
LPFWATSKSHPNGGWRLPAPVAMWPRTWWEAVPAGRRASRVAASHSITSSARASSVRGTSRPSAREAFRLRIKSNLIGCSIGRSPGLTPFRIFRRQNGLLPVPTTPSSTSFSTPSMRRLAAFHQQIERQAVGRKRVTGTPHTRIRRNVRWLGRANIDQPRFIATRRVCTPRLGGSNVFPI